MTKKRTKRAYKRKSTGTIDRKLLAPGKQTAYPDTTSILSNIFLSRRFQQHHVIDLTKYTTLSAEKLLDILIDSNPDVSQALYSFLRMCNSGYRIKVLKPNGNEFSKGQKIMDEWVKKLNLQQNNYGFKEDRSLISLVNKIHFSLFVKGATSTEIALDQRLNPSFIVAIDPSSIYFKRDNEELVPHQFQKGKYKPINIPSFFYQPLDARLDDVYGVCPILPALQIIFFQIQILQDLQAVVHKAGYPRIDIRLLEEILIKNAPPAIRNDAKKLATWLNERKAAIETEYKNIKPDDAAIHFDSVELKYLEAQSGVGSYDVRALIEIVDAQVIASLKSLSILMGRYKGRTETYASAEVQLYIKGVEAIQQISGLLMSKVLTFCLNMFGYQGYVEFGYLPIELRSKTELAQWDAIRIRNYLILVALGMESFEDACIELTGHRPTGDVNKDLELILALLDVEYPSVERPGNDKDKDKDKDKNNFHTVADLLNKINGTHNNG